MQSIFAHAAHAISGAATYAAKIWNKVRSTRPIKVAIAACVTGLKITAAGLLVASLTAGFIAVTLSQYAHVESEASSAPIEALPPCKPRNIKQVEMIQNEVLVTPISDETLLYQSFYDFKETQGTSEIQESPSTEAFATRDIKPHNNRLALALVCWQAFASVAEALKSVKASELKKVASDQNISGYRRMNKSELLVAIASATAA